MATVDHTSAFSLRKEYSCHIKIKSLVLRWDLNPTALALYAKESKGRITTLFVM